MAWARSMGLGQGCQPGRQDSYFFRATVGLPGKSGPVGDYLLNKAMRFSLFIFILALAGQAMAAKDEKGLSRRNFLKGMGTVAAAPLVPPGILPSVPLASPVVATVLPDAVVNPVNGIFRDILGIEARNGIGRLWWESARIKEIREASLKFAEEYETHNPGRRFLPDGEEVYGNNPLLNGDGFAHEIADILSELFEQKRYDSKFLLQQGLRQMRLLESRQAELQLEDSLMRSGVRDPMIEEFRELFMESLKQRLPMVYNAYLRSMTLSTKSFKDAYYNIGFRSEDVARERGFLQRHLEAKAKSEQLRDQRKTGQGDPAPEVPETSKVLQVRSVLLRQIQDRAVKLQVTEQLSCEQLLLDQPESDSRASLRENEL